jgi:hypothetical protein
MKNLPHYEIRVTSDFGADVVIRSEVGELDFNHNTERFTLAPDEWDEILALIDRRRVGSLDREEYHEPREI